MIVTIICILIPKIIRILYYWIYVYIAINICIIDIKFDIQTNYYIYNAYIQYKARKTSIGWVIDVDITGAIILNFKN